MRLNAELIDCILKTELRLIGSGHLDLSPAVADENGYEIFSQ